MHLELAKTLRNYEQKKFIKGHPHRADHYGCLDPDFHGLCPDCGASGGLWTVWLCIPDHFVWAVFHIASVHLRSGCSTCSVSRGGTGGNGNPEWFETGNGGCAGAHIFVAVWLFVFAFLKAGKLVNYISAPVMGGFITGICTTIILMQVPN